ncbi:MAG: CHRD domain-containing protein [Acetobacteraceae bacterium]
MRVAKVSAGVALVALLAWVLSVASVQAAPVSFTVALSGASQVPPVATQGKGTADLTYDATTRTLKWSVTTSDLSSAVTMAHFHGPAVAGKNGRVQIWISKRGKAPSNPITGEATLTQAQAEMLMDDELYINVHTKDHPAGEIRGQVVPPKS